MPVVIHGITDGVDQAQETISAVIRNIEAIPEPSLEHTQCLDELKALLPGLSRARAKAVAAQRRTRTNVIRG